MHLIQLCRRLAGRATLLALPLLAAPLTLRAQAADALHDVRETVEALTLWQALTNR